MSGSASLVLACGAMVLLVIVVALRMLRCRIVEMRARRIHPQSIATSTQMASRFDSVQAADNYRNLFEAPVLFYLLCALAIALRFTPGWLVGGAWAYVALRYAHSLIHCSYNKVTHRFAVFAASLGLLALLWSGLVAGVLGQHAG